MPHIPVICSQLLMIIADFPNILILIHPLSLAARLYAAPLANWTSLPGITAATIPEPASAVILADGRSIAALSYTDYMPNNRQMLMILKDFIPGPNEQVVPGASNVPGAPAERQTRDNFSSSQPFHINRFAAWEDKYWELRYPDKYTEPYNDYVVSWPSSRLRFVNFTDVISGYLQKKGMVCRTDPG